MKSENRARIAELLREAQGLVSEELNELTANDATSFESLTTIVNDKLDLVHLLGLIREARRFI